jgi:hypothetical protein
MDFDQLSSKLTKLRGNFSSSSLSLFPFQTLVSYSNIAKMVEKKTAKRNILTFVRILLGIGDLATDITYFATADFADAASFAFALTFKIWFCSIIFLYTFVRLYRIYFKESWLNAGNLFLIIIFLPVIVPIIVAYGLVYYNWGNNGNDKDGEAVESGNRVILSIETMSESFPQIVIQGINNTATGDWGGIAIISFFFSFVGMLADIVRVIHEFVENKKAKRYLNCLVRVVIMVVDFVTDMLYVATQDICNDDIFNSLIAFIVIAPYFFTFVYCLKYIWFTPARYFSIVVFLCAPLTYIFFFIWVFVRDKRSSIRSRVFMVGFEILLETFPQLILQGVNNSCLGQWNFVAAVSYSTSLVALLSEVVLMFVETKMKNRDQVHPQ